MEMNNAKEERVVQAAAKEEEETVAPMKVWVAIDESEESLYALRWALAHLFPHHNPDDVHDDVTAGDDGPAMMTVVHVQPPFAPSYTAVPAGPILFATRSMTESLKNAEEETTARILSSAFELCKQYKMKADAMVIKGDPKKILVEAVEQLDVDLLVVGSRGLGQIKRALLGSVSDYLAHHAKCPVLIVRPHK